jgi:hypothetical protein
VTYHNIIFLQEARAPDKEIAKNTGDIVIYTSADRTVQTKVRMESETLWLAQ